MSNCIVVKLQTLVGCHVSELINNLRSAVNDFRISSGISLIGIICNRGMFTLIIPASRNNGKKYNKRNQPFHLRCLWSYKCIVELKVYIHCLAQSLPARAHGLVWQACLPE